VRVRVVRPLRRLASPARDATRLRGLPPHVALFHWRARRLARRIGDQFSLSSATPPADLIVLLELARDRPRVVEIGTGTGWTAIALALSDPLREVISYEPAPLAQRDRYLELIDPTVRRRIKFVVAPGSAGPRDGDPVDLVYVDSSHTREDTIEELHAWLPALREGGVIALDDYGHPDFPGVRQAVEELGLTGEQRGTLFVHRVQAGD
jgi:predicted O-methyltransferase YrrM